MYIHTKVTCQDCGHEWDEDEGYTDVCPECNGTWLHRLHIGVCECGAEIWMGNAYNECPDCGRAYNAFGQELAPPDQWDEEDRYGTFGPLNDPNYDY